MVKLETVQDYLAAGLAVIPVSQEEDALPLEQEKAQHLPTEDEIMTSFSEEQNAVGLVCGETSGNLEIISFYKNFEKWKNTISPELFAKLVVEQTPSGGYHVAYRCKESASESCFLAEEMHDDEPVPLIKLHGKGDCVVCSPTNGYKLIQGDYTALPCLDGTERERLLCAAWIPQPIELSPIEKNAKKFKEQILSAENLIQNYPQMKEPLIYGLLRREELMNIIAAPKTGKSWLVLQLAIALATGKEWLGRECTKSKVLLIDNELHMETLSGRLREVSRAMGVPADSLRGLDVLPLRGRIKSLKSIGEMLIELVKEGEISYDVMILDALYKALPEDVDENSNGQITGIYNQLEAIASSVKSAFVMVHHTSKGNQANKAVTDIGSGAGAQSRAPDTHLTLRPHSEPGIISVFCCVRSFRPVEPFCIMRDGDFLWVEASDYDPNALEGKDASSEHAQKMKQTVDDVSESIAEHIENMKLPMSKTRLVETIRDGTGSSKSKIISALDLLCEEGILEIRRGSSDTKQQASKLYFHGPESRFYQPPETDIEPAEQASDVPMDTQEDTHDAEKMVPTPAKQSPPVPLAENKEKPSKKRSARKSKSRKTPSRKTSLRKITAKTSSNKPTS